MEIKGFIPSSLLEWEGKLASVLFLPRCNLRCRYCHAGDLVTCPENLDTVPVEQVLEHLRTNSRWVDGVAITGGEPTLHGDELLGLIERLRNAFVEVMVETNGTRPERVEDLLGDHVDAIAMDVKAPLDGESYERVTSAEVDVEAVRRSIRAIHASGLPYEFRVTLVPGLVGREELERLLPELEGSRQIALQNFRPEDCLDPDLRQVVPFRPEEMDAFAQMAAPYCDRCVVRGREHALSVRAGVAADPGPGAA